MMLVETAVWIRTTLCLSVIYYLPRTYGLGFSPTYASLLHCLSSACDPDLFHGRSELAQFP